MKRVTLGGDRVGSGNRMKVDLHGFERSTHDLGYLWRSTMACGTLVPFMNLVALPGDTFDIKLNADVKTYPTTGPLFGSFKLQLDVFACPIRLYQGQLHNNKLGIGMAMDKVKLPLFTLKCNEIDPTQDEPIEIQQINPSSLLAYLGIRGVGGEGNAGVITRDFNALPLLSYWDIYKNYYSNRQEGIGVYIADTMYQTVFNNLDCYDNDNIFAGYFPNASGNLNLGKGYKLIIHGSNLDARNLVLTSATPISYILSTLGYTESNTGSELVFILNNLETATGEDNIDLSTIETQDAVIPTYGNIVLNKFDLDNLDNMRETILSKSLSPNPFKINTDCNVEPYATIIGFEGNQLYSKRVQNGLGIKTYQSDIFNNWLSSEWIDGVNGIAEITSVDTTSGSFTLDTLNLSKKVYDMLNRIAVSGGSYDDWLEAVYDHDVYGKPETPVYCGGMSQEVIFQQVVSQTATDDDPLGSLGGRGELSNNRKGGSVTVKVSEPSIILGIVSLTPRIDYSQGNDWSVNLKTMDDFHKPNLDEIGFQDLITEQMAFWESNMAQDGSMQFMSAGKQPAWLNYMTNYNKCYGEFANPDTSMFMTLNRRYEYDSVTKRIKDLTTYIDPTKYNEVFAVKDLSAQNFWVQLGVDVEARRKISARIMPNL